MNDQIMKFLLEIEHFNNSVKLFFIIAVLSSVALIIWLIIFVRHRNKKNNQYSSDVIGKISVENGSIDHKDKSRFNSKRRNIKQENNKGCYSYKK